MYRRLQMPKDVLTEGIIDKIITKIFTALVTGKNKAIMKMVAKDPELKRLTKAAEDAVENTRDYLQKRENRRKKTGKFFPDAD